MASDSDIRGTWKQRLAGKIIALIIRLNSLTLRFTVKDPHSVRAAFSSGSPVIWAFWHNCLFVAPVAKKHIAGNAKTHALSSASKDGAIIASLGLAYGILPVRGSSSRRGAAALISLKRILKKGEQVFITPDGPRGPRYHLQPGVIKLAQSAETPIACIRYTFSSSWRIKSWDKLRIPKPFSKVTIHLDQPINVPKKLDPDEFENQRQLVETTLRQGADDIPENE
ncbi:MAG: lysophospholipid acyltransferase family protein [Akkermansiaceae bacterium]